ncbi:SAC3/GANP/Nin1/mts3/eIF-3 p25 family isoform X2 [Wolffia australiana]
MEERARPRGGRSWRPREGAGELPFSPSSSFSSSSSPSSYGNKWEPSSSWSSSSSIKSGRDHKQVPKDKQLIGSGARIGNPPEMDFIIGTCLDMCPAKEREQREKFRDLAVFERLHGNPQRTTSKLAVKKFCRTMSAASEQPSSIRPLPVLQESLRYLLDIVESSDQPFHVIHDFVLDRTRAIRQDLSIQNIVHHDVVVMYEEMVRFHIISEKRLRKECSKVDLPSLLHLNMEQMMKSLTSLYNLYRYNQRSGGKNYNEAEFYSFYLILQLTRNREDGNSLSLWLRKMPSSILQSTEVIFARSILRFVLKHWFALIIAVTSFSRILYLT